MCRSAVMQETWDSLLRLPRENLRAQLRSPCEGNKRAAPQAKRKEATFSFCASKLESPPGTCAHPRLLWGNT